jgi:hypothetical protein
MAYSTGNGEPRVTRVSATEPSFYQPVDIRGKEDGFEAYLRFLEERNGKMDFERRQYTAREEHLERLRSSTAAYVGPFDEALFRRQYRSYDRRQETSPATQLLLLFCKVNAGEAFGVEIMREARKEYFDRPEAQFRTEKIITNEEEYHTKYLVGATQYFGLTMNEAFQAPLSLKVLIHGLANAPAGMFHSVLLAAELAGIYTFHTLLEATRVVLKDQPEVRDALEERLFAVLIDEVGHVSYNRLALGSWGLRMARVLFPVVHKGVAHNAEMRALEGLLGRRIPLGGFDFKHLPDGVRRRAFFA